MRQSRLQFLIPGELRSGTGGYVYDRRLLEGLGRLGWEVCVHALDGSFPHPTPRALAHAQSLLSRLPDGALVLIDGLALGAMPGLIEAQAARLALIALIHMPLGAQLGLTAALAGHRQQQELRALRRVRHVVVTSHATEQLLAAQGVPTASLVVIEPGSDPAPLARRRYEANYRLLCVATLTEGKGHELLIKALRPLAHLPWELRCIGSLTRSPGTVERVRALLEDSGLEARVQLIGELPHEEVSPYYASSDLFVLATYRESYCMAVAEALAHGLPVIGTRTGAIAQLVGAHAGILVEPGDGLALQTALARVLQHPSLAGQMAQAALLARKRLAPWELSCRQLSAVLARVAQAASRSTKECAG